METVARDRERELIIAGALFLAEAERREFAGLTAITARAKARSCAEKIESGLKAEEVRKLKRAHYEAWCRSVGQEPDPRYHAKYVPEPIDYSEE